MIPEPKFLADYLSPKDNKPKRHKFYTDSCNLAEEMLIHFDGLKPGKLLSERRPSESVKIQEFRQIIYKSKTKAHCDKIMNALMKIRKSSDWMIKYPDIDPKDEVHSIKPDETLQQYMEKSFPRYDSFTNWYFQIGFKAFLTDPNSVCLIKPLKEEINDNDYYKPYPFVFSSKQVIDYDFQNWYLLESEEKSIYTDGKQTFEGFKYLYVDKEGIYTISQVNAKGGYSIEEFIHGLDYCPVIEFGGIVQKETPSYLLRQSRVYGIVPSFDEAVREYSDLQAEVLQHIHSTMWAHAGQDCRQCKGVGKVPKKGVVDGVKCSECKGKGTIPFDPYSYYEIPRPKPGETTISGIPIGYVQKQIDIAILQNTRIKDHIKDGLSAVNMEFLIDPPQLNQSGTAKEVDKDDMHTFFHVVAEDVVSFFDKFYKVTNDERYSVIVSSKEQRTQMLPSIPVPEKYDILSETYLVNEIKLLTEAHVSPSIIKLSQKEYVNKKFFADMDAQKHCTSVLELDPLSGRSEDDILLQLTNGGVDELDYTVHCNIDSFVRQASEADENFFTLKVSEQQEKIYSLAKAKNIKTSASAKVIQMNNAA